MGYTAFAITDICAKWLSAEYSVYQIIVAQNGIACVLLVAFSPFLGGMRCLLNRRNWRVNAFRAGINVLIAIILTYSYKHFALADVYTLIFTLPFMTALLSLWFFREPVTRCRWIAIGTGFTGVLIAMRPGAADFNPEIIIVLAGTVLVALLYTSTRFLHDPSAFCVGFVPAFGAAAFCLPLAATDFEIPDMTHLPIFLLMGAMIGFGITAVSLAFRIAPAAVVAPFLYIEMLWALGSGWLLFGDKPDVWMLAGAAIIILSGIYLLRAEWKNAPP